MQGLGPDAFTDSCRALGLGEDGPLAVAVSGGPDSLALLLIAHRAFPGRLRALTVDHGLRDGSAGEAAMVATACAGLGVPHATLAWTGDKPRASLQAAARDARYALMDDWCATNGVAWLLTAHHADDQAETLLMRLARGSGSAGLAGIRARRVLPAGTTLLRPLLGVRRSALHEIVAASGLAPVDDPANRDPRHDRTGARATLAATPWLDPVRLAAAAAHLAEAEAALDWTARLAWDSRVTIGEAVVIDVAGLPPEIRRRLVVRALALSGDSPDGPAIDRMIADLAAGGTATLAGIRGVGGPMWTFSRVPHRVKG